MGRRGVLIGAALLAGSLTGFGGAGPAAPSLAAADTIGIIDFYGLRKITQEQARAALGLKEGEGTPGSAADIAGPIRCLSAIPGVERARIERVCCDEQGRSILFIGIEEKGAPRFRYLPTPRRALLLPSPVVDAHRRFEEAHEVAVRRGDAGDDLSQGHSLMTNPEVRRIQQEFVPLAATYPHILRAVLRESADREQRRIAAWVLCYTPEKGAVIGALTRAVRDPDEGVRNNATRSLAAIATMAQRKPELGIRIDPAPFIAMLSSVTWSDRNKAAMVLMALSADRARRVLGPLRRRAMPSLVEMARWKSGGHALPAYVILGRIAGMKEPAIWDAWTRGERESVITRALETRL